MRDIVCRRVIGRDPELAVLRERLTTAAHGHGGVVFVTGEAGIGKSRLAREVVRWAEDQDTPVLIGRAVPEAAGGLLRPVAEILMQAFRRLGAPTDPAVTRWLPALARLVPALGLGFATPREAGVADGADAATLRGEALIRILRWVAGGGPLLVVLEDLHWADADTVAIVEYLADNLATEAALMVCTVRDMPSPALDIARRLRQRGASTIVGLGPLDDAAVDEMIYACVPDADRRLADRVRHTADGVPLLVEEVLASPGVPETIGEAVRARVADLGAEDREVLSTAAILGRDFDWRVLPAITGLPPATVAAVLGQLVDACMVDVVGDGFRFRHALIREAAVEGIVPPARIRIARAALATLEVLDPDGDYVEVCLLAGDRARAASALIIAGKDALRRGALTTAADLLRRAADLVDDDTVRHDAQCALVGALSLAGRLDEATAVAGPLLRGLGSGRAARRVHLDLAGAAVSATRWAAAATHLKAATAAAVGTPDESTGAKLAVLEAEIALAADDMGSARAAAQAALGSAERGDDPATVCQALDLLGRSYRVHDLERAREAFQRAHEIATYSDLPVSQLHSLHELGTVDMLDHGGTQRLADAREIAERLGLMSTVAVLDLQLAGAHLQQFNVVKALHATRRSLALAQTLRLDRIRAFACVFEACIAALRGERDAVQAATAAATQIAPHDAEIEGLTSAGGGGTLELLWGSRTTALASLDRGLAALHTVAHSPPGPYRGLWPLVVAAQGRADAQECLDTVHRSGVAVNRINRGYLHYAEAVIDRSGVAVERGDRDLEHFPVWQHIGRTLLAEGARRDGWGDPSRWLTEAATCLAGAGLTGFARHCDRLLGRSGEWSPAGMTEREGDVFALVTEGLTNKEIAERLRLSVRTVEKHVESVLRKADARSRTQLVAKIKMGGTT